MSERFDLDDYPEVFELWVEESTKTYPGDRGRFGVPESPDYDDTRYQIARVVIMTIDVTDHFDTETFFDEENGEMSSHIEEVIQDVFGGVK